MTRSHAHRASGGTTYRDPLRNSEFRGLVVAQVASEWGDNIARVALASLVLARTDSAFLAVLAFVVSFVPAVFGAALLGTAADRFPRKVVLIGCDLARAVVITVLALRRGRRDTCVGAARTAARGGDLHRAVRGGAPRGGARTCWPSPARSSPAPG